MATKNFKTTDLSVLNEMLHNGIVEFQFTKKDGTIRQAKGTLQTENIPAHAIKGTGRPSNPNVQVYWDMDKQEFRSFVKSSFAGAY